MANPFSVAPLGGLQTYANIGNTIGAGIQNYQAGQQEQELQQQQKALQTEAQRLMREGTPQEIAAFSAANPEIGKAMQQGVKFASDQTRQNMQESMQRVIAGEDPVQVIKERADMVRAQGGDPSDTMRDLELAQQDPEAYREMISRLYAMRFGTEGVPGIDSGGTPAQTQAFNALVEASKSDDPTVRQAARIELGLEPRAGTLSADQRTALDDFLKGKVVDLERETSAAKEEGKLETQGKLLPKIRESVKLAEQEAQSRGEALSEYGRAKASLPGLRDVVGKLKTLSDVATYTMAGRAFDTVVKELGFGATEGATARAKMDSLVSNQILPLLKETFGAQFTAAEGEKLRETMLDINASPEQKKEILDSFLEQKIRDLEMKRGRVEDSGAEVEGGAPMSEEEADAFINQMLEQ